MKNLNFLQKIIFFINNVFALLLVLSIVLPYLPPKQFPTVSVLSLGVPVLLVIHLCFIIYWIVSGFKKQLLLSTICIICTIAFSYFPYQFNGQSENSSNAIRLMSYNVRLFNLYGWIEDTEIPHKISKFIANEEPDILTIQEHDVEANIHFNYPYRYEKTKKTDSNFGLAIFSNYPIIKKGSLELNSNSNNIIYADIKIKKDTVRIYNLHLESFGLQNELNDLDEKKSRKIFKRIAQTFETQQEQVEKLLQHLSTCEYKTIICGDFNNTAYSWAYKKIKGNLQDTFLQAGSRFGETYAIKRFPLRIDFILVDQSIEVLSHHNFKINYSDHKPVAATIELVH